MEASIDSVANGAVVTAPTTVQAIPRSATTSPDEETVPNASGEVGSAWMATNDRCRHQRLPDDVGHRTACFRRPAPATDICDRHVEDRDADTA